MNKNKSIFKILKKRDRDILKAMRYCKGRFYWNTKMLNLLISKVNKKQLNCAEFARLAGKNTNTIQQAYHRECKRRGIKSVGASNNVRVDYKRCVKSKKKIDRISDSDRKAMIDMWESGMDVDEIAKRFGVSYCTMVNWLGSLKKSKNRRKAAKKAFLENKLSNLYEVLNSGNTIEQAARILDSNSYYVYRKIRKDKLAGRITIRKIYIEKGNKKKILTLV